MKKIKLDKSKQTKLEVLNWLLDPDAMRSGRTTLMAIAYINIALKKPGMIIEINDHHPGYEADRMILGVIRDLVVHAGLAKRFHAEQNRRFWIEAETIHEFVDKHFNLKTCRTGRTSSLVPNISNTPKKEPRDD